MLGQDKEEFSHILGCAVMEWVTDRGREALEAVPSQMLEFALLKLLGSPNGLTLAMEIRDGEKVPLHSRERGDSPAVHSRNTKRMFTEKETRSNHVL